MWMMKRDLMGLCIDKRGTSVGEIFGCCAPPTGKVARCKCVTGGTTVAGVQVRGMASTGGDKISVRTGGIDCM